MTSEQLYEIFNRLLDTELRFLNLSYCDLSSVPADILVSGISGLEEVCLTFTDLTTQQLLEIFMMVAERRCGRVRKINLLGNFAIYDVSEDLIDSAKLNQSVEIRMSRL